MKRCPRCGEVKPYSEFHRSRRRHDGRQSTCISCRAVIDHDLYERRRGIRTPSRIWEHDRRAWLLSLKAGKPCTDCARFFPPQVLQWDHLPGYPKRGDISTFRGRSRQEILDEIAKCELVCANCHALRTFERAGWAISWTELEWESPLLSSVGGRLAMGDLGLNSSVASVVRVDGDGASADPTLKQCAMCGLWKPPSEFHDSKTGQFSYCRPCRRAYDRNYYHQRGRTPRLARQRARVKAARAWMTSLKQGLACTDCGQRFPPWVMHWDHLPGRKKVACISDLVGSRRRTLALTELEKCELVCANCHVLRTINRAGRSAAW